MLKISEKLKMLLFEMNSIKHSEGVNGLIKKVPQPYDYTTINKFGWLSFISMKLREQTHKEKQSNI